MVREAAGRLVVAAEPREGRAVRWAVVGEATAEARGAVIEAVSGLEEASQVKVALTEQVAATVDVLEAAAVREDTRSTRPYAS